MSDTEIAAIGREYNALRRHTLNSNPQTDLQNIIKTHMVEVLAHNIVSYGARNKDGYLIINRQAYGSKEALSKAQEHVNSLLTKGRPLPPLSYPIRNDLPTNQYPDVTVQYNKIINDYIKQNLEKNVADRHIAMWDFRDNAELDLQVNHGLPGQFYIGFDISGKVATTDQYAIYKGQVRRAGYFSNYFYGKMMKAYGYPLEFAEIGANGYSSIFKSSNDNPNDLEAIRDAYRDQD